MRAFALVLVLSSGAAGQTSSPPDASPAPSDAPPAHAAPSIAPDEASPTQFPGVTEGGVVSAATYVSDRPWPTQRHFALVATEGSFSGYGLGFRAGWLRAGLDGAFAYTPLLATYSPDPEKFPEFKLLSSFQASASIYVGLHRLDARTDLGVAFGYRYNTLMRHGATVAFYFQRELAAHWTLQGFVGPCIFPDAEDQIRQKTGWVGGSVLSGLAGHQAGVGLSIAFYP